LVYLSLFIFGGFIVGFAGLYLRFNEVWQWDFSLPECHMASHALIIFI